MCIKYTHFTHMHTYVNMNIFKTLIKYQKKDSQIKNEKILWIDMCKRRYPKSQ